jgi:hypothetical protein
MKNIMKLVLVAAVSMSGVAFAEHHENCQVGDKKVHVKISKAHGSKLLRRKKKRRRLLSLLLLQKPLLLQLQLKLLQLLSKSNRLRIVNATHGMQFASRAFVF